MSLALLWLVPFILDRVAELLNLRSASQPLAKELWEIQSEEDHQKAFEYLSDRTRLTWFRESLFLVLFLCLWFSGFLGSLAEWAVTLTSNGILQGLVFAGALGLVQLLFSIPFSWISTFKIEAKYGFNRTTPKIFFTDLLKSLLISAVIGGGLYSLAVYLFQFLGENAWLYTAIIFTGIQLFLVWIAPVTLLPLFLKLTPLFEGELKKSIEDYAQKHQFKLNGVWVCDASKRSSKTNAFFTGFGKFRRLVLFDTLIAKHPTTEVLAVTAHEAGHFKLGHIWRGSLLSVVTSFVFLFLAQKLATAPELLPAFHINPESLTYVPAVGLIFAGALLDRISFFFGFVTMAISRKHEYEADAFAIQTTKQKEPMIGALKRLSTDNLAILNPHPLYVAMTASHPPLVARIAAIEKLKT